MTEQVNEDKAGTPEPAGSRGRAREVEQPERTKKSGKTYEIDIFRDWCKCCGICAAFCPRECIKLDEDDAPVIEKSERCTGCGWCEVHCPDFAISVREQKMIKVENEEY